MKNELITKNEVMTETVIFENADFLLEAFFHERIEKFTIWFNGENIASFKSFNPFATKLAEVVERHNLIRSN